MSVRIAPTAPIRLMMALALLRKGLDVKSGMRAIAGAREMDMANKTSPKPRLKSQKSLWLVA